MDSELRHVYYLERLVVQLSRLVDPDPSVGVRIAALGTVILATAGVNFEAVRSMLEAYYHRRPGGKPPRDPVAMLRSWFLMNACGFTDVNAWVPHMRQHPELAVVAGWEPDDGPGVGTYYDFAYRILDGPVDQRPSHGPLPSDGLKGVSGTFARNLTDEKEQAKKERTQAMLEAVLDGPAKLAVHRTEQTKDDPLPDDLCTRLNTILTACGTLPSANDGLLGPLGRLTAAGDSAPMPSGATPKGHALCSCRKDGHADTCTHDRLYSDPQARWGWDSHRDRYFFGYRLHALVNHHDDVELPLYLDVRPANTADILVGIDMIDRITKLFAQHMPDAHIHHALFDAAYDAAAFFGQLLDHGIRPVIAPNPAHDPATDPDTVPKDENGIPLCPGGATMRLHQHNLKARDTVYNCPAKRPGRTNGKLCFKVRLDRCPRGRLCQPDTVMGPLVHLKTKDHPRANAPVKPDSTEYNEVYPKRTCVERFFAQTQGPGGLLNRPYRRAHLFHLAALSRALFIHGRARAQLRFGKQRYTDAEQVLDALARLKQELSQAQAA